ncbi:MAG TPA: histidine phosphatase family protein [Spirochaetales bacterium]|nr:histidine phosphatase family protein [Spirochaetales bacterium]HRY55201.1 histidine phosphatase family protein [Spirochaetia bacterium]HRZ64603.1 histidine phosphatase family protein [Spirochaetia bacterium]
MDGAPTPSPAAAGAVDGSFFASLREETRFFILRHGQSEGNARLVIQGKLDFPLDGAGRSQARAAGEWLASRGIEEVISSPLARAAETARIVAAACGLGESSLHGSLAELDTGIFSGLSLEEAKERFPGPYAEFESRSWEGVPGAESQEALYGRALEAWELLRGRAAAGRRRIACVSHGGFIQWLLRSTFGCRSWMPLVPTGNCGVFELLVAPTGAGRPAYLQWHLVNFQPAAALASLPPVF